jgi:hypothetical protein
MRKTVKSQSRINEVPRYFHLMGSMGVRSDLKCRSAKRVRAVHAAWVYPCGEPHGSDACVRVDDSGFFSYDHSPPLSSLPQRSGNLRLPVPG